MTETLEKQDLVYGLWQLDGVMYAAKMSGLYASKDTAKTWQSVLAEHDASTITSVLGVSGQLFAASVGGIFKSTDAKNWQVVPFRVPAPTLSALSASLDFEKDKTVFAASLEDGVFRSVNAGKTWEAWNMGLFDLHVFALALNDENHVYAGSETGLYKSSNAARSWEVVAAPFEPDAVLSLLSLGNTLYVGTENNGLYSLTDSSWEKLELPSGAVNSLLALDNGGLLVLLDEQIYKTKHQSFERWRDFSEVTSLALSKNNQVLIGFTSGNVRLEAL